MKVKVIICLMIVTISLILVSGCMSGGVTATSCSKCDSDTHQKTSVATIAWNDIFHDSKDGIRLHLVDSDGIAYHVGPVAKAMTDLDKYNGEEVTFDYLCTKDGYYQIISIDFSYNMCDPKPVTKACGCVTPTPTPTCGCKV